MLLVFVLYETRTTPVPDNCPSFDLAAVRALAGQTEVQKVRSEVLSHIDVPLWLMSAGAGWSMHQLSIYAFQLVLADKTIIVDAAMPKENNLGGEYDDKAWTRLSKGIKASSAAYATHEHWDHISGYFSEDNAKYASLTPEQLSSGREDPLVIKPEQRAQVKTFAYDQMTRVAPGVVVIKAPGHTPGSQWFYVKRTDGKEMLIVGDTAWHTVALESHQGPTPLISLMLKNDRDATSCQLATLDVLRKDLTVIPGHDGEYVDALVKDGTLETQFQ